MSFRVRLARSRPMRLLGNIALKCWAFSSVYLLICFLLYWLYGGILAFILLCFATAGSYCLSFFSRNQYLYLPCLCFFPQEFSIIGKTSFSIIQSCQPIPESMFLPPPSLVYRIKVYILDPEMVQCCICFLSRNRRTE